MTSTSSTSTWRAKAQAELSASQVPFLGSRLLGAAKGASRNGKECCIIHEFIGIYAGIYTHMSVYDGIYDGIYDGRFILYS